MKSDSTGDIIYDSNRCNTNKYLKIQVYLDNIRLFLKAKDSKNRTEAIMEMIESIENLVDVKN